MEEEKIENPVLFGPENLDVNWEEADCCSLPYETLIKRTFQSQLQNMSECEIFDKFIDVEVWDHLALKTNTYSKEYLTSTVGKHILDQKKFSK